MKQIKTLIIEDEPLSRKRHETLLSGISTIELIGVFDNPQDARSVIQNGEVDLILSDIQMPEIDGVSFLRSLKNPPIVVFVTGHPEFAVDSFDLDVVDYILKPLTLQRLMKSVGKVEAALKNKKSSTLKQGFIRIKDRNRTAFLSPSEIYYIQGWGDYVKVITNDGVTTLNYSMKEMEDLLPATMFIRIQRSYIVNIDYVTSVDATKVFLKERSETLPIGLHYRKIFFKKMGIKGN